MDLHASMSTVIDCVRSIVDEHDYPAVERIIVNLTGFFIVYLATAAGVDPKELCNHFQSRIGHMVNVNLKNFPREEEE